MNICAVRTRSSCLAAPSTWLFVLGAVLFSGGAGGPWGGTVAHGQACQEQQKLAASDAAAGDSAGHTVSISGDTAIVGALFDDDVGTSSGSAYVFVRSGPPGEEVWNQLQKLTASDGEEDDHFGVSVSISGDTAIVGAWEDNAPAFDSGSAYVFVRSGPPGEGVWNQQQKLTASNGAEDDHFGDSVSISGDTAIVGASGDDAPAPDSGSAYVFVRSGPPGEEIWTQQLKLTASDGEAGDHFGGSVFISGDTAIVGASGDDAPAPDSGSAYVFVRSGPPGEEVWTQQLKLTASDGGENDQFGTSVSLSGDTAIVGAWLDDVPVPSSGSAYVFQCDFDCPADITPSRGGDGVVDVDDLLMMLSAWGTCDDPENCPTDLDDDGTVNVDDLQMLIRSWGPC